MASGENVYPVKVFKSWYSLSFLILFIYFVHSREAAPSAETRRVRSFLRTPSLPPLHPNPAHSSSARSLHHILSTGQPCSPLPGGLFQHQGPSGGPPHHWPSPATWWWWWWGAVVVVGAWLLLSRGPDNDWAPAPFPFFL